MSALATISDKAKLDAINNALLPVTGSFTVHLGSNSPTISGSSSIGTFTEASYPGYAASVWDPRPVAINGAHHAVCVPGSCSFAGPSSGSATINSVFVTYTAADSTTQLLESFIITGAPLVLSSSSTTVTVNLSLDDYDVNH